ncbi:MAG TPA: alpha-ketoacid dehydrogenase subunit beta [Galbitalea sp.]|jgi:pyruvate dehydrogenase E1 component beta subunit|nr:alpha-ketoacid dehydrogenase subunit beta [Galbitalea sp.]HEX3962207.1 alpha-ketoacid dehydrogenase subunit beta [Trebonia sp.]
MSAPAFEATAPAASVKTTFGEACRRALQEAMRVDPDVFLLGEDIGDAEGGGTFKVTKGLSTEFGIDRVRTTPISEQAIVGAAIGAAIAGKRPVAEIMLMNFVTVAMDQIVNHAAKLRFMSGGATSVPITIRTATGAGRGTGAQHSDMLEAWFAHVPGLKVVVPSSPAEAKGLLLSCIFDDDPCIFVEKKEMYGVRQEVPLGDVRIPLSEAAIARQGTDVTIVAYGGAVSESLLAASKLAGDGIEAEVIDLRTVSPWDKQTVLRSVARTRGAVVVHEAVRQFGVGAEISATIHEELFGDLRAPVQRVASKNLPVPFAPTLEKAYLYSRDDIEVAVRRACAA